MNLFIELKAIHVVNNIQKCRGKVPVLRHFFAPVFRIGESMHGDFLIPLFPRLFSRFPQFPQLFEGTLATPM